MCKYKLENNICIVISYYIYYIILCYYIMLLYYSYYNYNLKIYFETCVLNLRRGKGNSISAFRRWYTLLGDFPGGSRHETQVLFLSWEDSL